MSCAHHNKVAYACTYSNSKGMLVYSPCIIHFHIAPVSQHSAEDVLVLVRDRNHVTPDTACALLGNVSEAIWHQVQDGLLLVSPKQHEVILHGRVPTCNDAMAHHSTCAVLLIPHAASN